MNHSEVEATGAVERYLLKEMNESEALRFEEHYFACAECADHMRSSTIFLTNLRTVLREPFAVTGMERSPSKTQRRHWTVPLSIAAGVLLAISAGYQNLVQIPRLRHEIAMAVSPDSPPVYDLVETRSANNENVIVAQPGIRRVSLLLNQIPGRIYPYYECELRDGEDRMVRTFRVKVMPGPEQWQVPLDLRGLPPQAYTLLIRGAQAASGPATEDAGEYHFKVEMR